MNGFCPSNVWSVGGKHMTQQQEEKEKREKYHQTSATIQHCTAPVVEMGKRGEKEEEN